jgi:hypothetical protein
MEPTAKLFVLGIASLVAAGISFIIGSVLVWLGAVLAGIRNATFGKAMATALLSAIVWWIVPGILHYIPCIGWILGPVLAFFITLAIVMAVFNCPVSQAAVAWILYIIGFAIAKVIAFPIFR